MTNEISDLFVENLNEQEKFWCMLLLHKLSAYKVLGGIHGDRYDDDDLRVLESCGLKTEKRKTKKLEVIPVNGPDKNEEVKGKEVLATLKSIIKEEKPNKKEEKKKKYKKPIEIAYIELEKNLGSQAYEVTNANILNLANSLGLNKVELRLLNFVVSLKSKVTLQTILDSLPEYTLDKTYQVLGFLISEDRREIKKAFSNDSVLIRSGFLGINKYQGAHRLDRRIEVLSGHFIELVTDESKEVPLLDMLSDRITKSEEAKLNIDDYDYIKSDYNFLKGYLKQSIQKEKKGVNVLVYGPPGTGKTELVRLISDNIEASLYEVSGVDSEGNALSAAGRKNAYSAAQVVLEKNRNLILFDEIEDIFRSNLFSDSYADEHKYVFTRLLESNPVPAVWVSNDVDCMDNAILRRFDMVIELGVPPKSKRKEIIQKKVGELIDAADVEALSDHKDLSPAVIERVSDVLAQTGVAYDKAEQSTHFKRLVNNVLKAQGHREVKPPVAHNLVEFDPLFISCNVDIQSIPEKLTKSGSGRICIYGPPGTGKTAYGNWVAKELGKPLLLKKVSDLVDMWVGATERNIAAAFEEARESGSVLMIDEVDSFLQDRRNSQRSWEITQINEMLTQMESFEGVFIASTNLIGGLDMASLRRFDLKIKFDYLKANQAITLFEKVCEQLSIEQSSDNVKKKLSSIDVLTPGDFVVIQRRHRFAPFDNADQVYEVLMHEASFKEQSSKPIRFIH